MRALVASALAALALAFIAPVTSAIGHQLANPRAGLSRQSVRYHIRMRHRTPSLVTLSVAVGYSGQYRTTAWTPVRVTLHNRSNRPISGTVDIPDTNSANNLGPPQPFHSVYQLPIVLPAGATKHATLYLPGSDIQSEVDVFFRNTNNRTLATVTTYPTSFGGEDLTVGTLTNDLTTVRWLNRVNPLGVNVDIVHLNSSTLDPISQALATFDVIVLTNFNTASLNRDQMLALEEYVRMGGALVLVGGPDWQETLRPLAAALLPGRLNGSRTVPNLAGLSALGEGMPPRSATAISLLSHPGGTVLASEVGIPLVVWMSMGQGQILYLAFDPAIDPILHWTRSSDLVTRLVTSAAPTAMSRAALPVGYQPPQFFGPFGPTDIGRELTNVPAAALPSLILFIALTAFYILLLGPTNSLILRRLRRRELGWLTIPTLALLCVGTTFGVAYHLKGSTVLLNTVSMVQLDGSDAADPGSYPATMYIGLFAPLRGTYQLSSTAPALPAIVPQVTYYGPVSPSYNTPLGLRFQEGARTQIQFVSMNMWSMRDVALHTSVNIPGSLQTTLHLDANGNIVGTIRNGTNLNLIRPLIIAGRAVTHLPDLPAGVTIRVHIRPDTNIHAHDHTPILLKIYGQPSFNGFYGFGGFGGHAPVVPAVVPSRRFCCWGPPPPRERTLTDRIRNVANMLPEAQTISALGEILLVAWNQQPLGSFTVDGVTPQRRDFNLIVTPLSVHLPSGTFHLRTGTLAAHLIDENSVPPQNGCCNPGIDSIYLGTGGWAIFEFDFPAAGHVHFRVLKLSVDAGGADGSDIGHVYNWQTRHWDYINLESGDAQLREPDRYISSTGALLLKIQATDTSGDIQIWDPHQDIQVSGTGVVR
jgi:hypothetical protein